MRLKLKILILMALSISCSAGTVDNAPATGAITDFFGDDDFAYGVARQPDGKIVAAGTAFSKTGTDFAIVRYSSAGIQDITFGTSADGEVITHVGSKDNAYDVAIQPDGKIVVAGVTNGGSSNSYDFAILRYTSEGNLDVSFGTGGIVITDFTAIGNYDSRDTLAMQTAGSSLDMAFSVALQSDGKIVVAGRSGHSKTDFALARYDSNGNLDRSFSNDGKVKTDFAGNVDSASALIIQPDGKIVATGFTQHTNTIDFAVARYHPNGSLDNSFSYDGKATTTQALCHEGDAMILQPNGKTIFAKSVYISIRKLFFKIRYFPFGYIDTQSGNW